MTTPLMNLLHFMLFWISDYGCIDSEDETMDWEDSTQFNFKIIFLNGEKYYDKDLPIFKLSKIINKDKNVWEIIDSIRLMNHKIETFDFVCNLINSTEIQTINTKQLVEVLFLIHNLDFSREEKKDEIDKFYLNLANIVYNNIINNNIFFSDKEIESAQFAKNEVKKLFESCIKIADAQYIIRFVNDRAFLLNDTEFEVASCTSLNFKKPKEVKNNDTDHKMRNIIFWFAKILRLTEMFYNINNKIMDVELFELSDNEDIVKIIIEEVFNDDIIEKVYVYDINMTKNDYKFILGLNTIKHIFIDKNNLSEDIVIVKENSRKNLKITFSNHIINTSDILNLFGVHCIQSIICKNCLLSTSDEKLIDNILHSLNSIDRKDSLTPKLIFDSCITDSNFFNKLNRLIDIESIELRNSNLSHYDLSSLFKITTLKELNLRNNVITAEKFNCEMNLPILKTLDFSGTKLSKEMVSMLKKFGKLEKINLDNCGIESASLKDLSEIQSLKTLRLRMNPKIDEESKEKFLKDKKHDIEVLFE